MAGPRNFVDHGLDKIWPEILIISLHLDENKYHDGIVSKQ